MASWTWDSLKRAAGVLKWATVVVGTPIKYIYKWTKAAIGAVLGYGKGIFTETYGGLKNGYTKMSEGFGKAHSQLSSALTKSKEAISKVFGVGKELTKWMGNIAKWTALAIGEVFKGTANGLVVNPVKNNIIKPLEKATNIKILPTGKSKAA
jgi:hypothetical protein